MIAPTQEKIVRESAGRTAPMKVALVCDFLEEGWYSMDLFGDMLLQCFRAEHSGEIEVEQLRPPMRRRFSARAGSRLFWNADRLMNRFQDYPRWLKKRASQYDLFHIVDHSYSQLVLGLPSAQTVVTCHDLDTFRCLLEPARERRSAWFRAMARRTFTGFLRAAHVICVSSFTKTELLRYGLFPEDRLSVISPGVDPVFFSTPEPSPTPAPVICNGPYLLHVGSTIARKRIDVLLQVAAQVFKKFPDLRLVRAGGAFTPEQSELAATLGIEDKVVQAPALSKVELARLYRGAALVLQPSEAEGFGLPVIESMACGCPVVASDIAPLREAGGSVTDYCPVGQIGPWSETAIRLLDERAGAPAAWQARQAQARQHASLFTWSRNGKQTMDVYRHVAMAIHK